MSAKFSAPQGSSAALKNAVCKRIAQAIVPDLYAQDTSTAGDRVRGRFLLLVEQYKTAFARLQATGGGPDVTTSEWGRNLWADIVKKFPFFPHLHLQLSKRPNIVPAAPASPPCDDTLDNIDLILRDLNVNVRPTPPASQPQSHASPEPSQENKAPLSTSKTGPRAFTFELKGKARLAAAMEKANIKALPEKRTLDDRLCKMQE
ncbi:hypothetical protein B0H21DRAFT_823610 [Amylocystis lapponica]|nr:hypothetical protein B0H21DRAFT_823610 [Amylocystis lapponica]